MNIELLKEKLLNAARINTPDDSVPYAFEKRIMAQLSSVVQVDLTTLWSRALWKAAAPCVALTVGLAAWVLVVDSSAQETYAEEALPPGLEQIVLAPLGSLEVDW